MTTSFLRASLVALGVLAAGPVLAQATTDGAAATTTEGDTTTTVVEGEATTTTVDGGTEAVEAVTTAEDDGFDWGWLGLLGLLGLAGLGGRRRETVIAHPTTVTTHSTTPR